METIEVPTFLCKGEHIVEVTFTEWVEVDDKWYPSKGSPVLILPENIDRAVFELPTGCVDIPVVKYGGAGMDFSIVPAKPGEGHTPRKCERLHGYDLEEGVVSSDVVGT